MTILAVIIGAFIGAPARFAIDRSVTARAGASRIPWGLVTVNVIGSAIAGIVLATTSGELRTLLLVGFCGAFTTFSGFGWEANRLWSADRRAFWITVLGMPIACTLAFLACWSLLTR